MRKKIVAGNWKMNLSIAEGTQLLNEILNNIPSLNEDQQVIFCCPFTHLDQASQVLKQYSNPAVHLGAQNCNDHTSGAFTGEISINMLKELGVDSVIIGHSERRQYYQEGNEFLKSKVNALVEAGMHVLFCCGESLDIRNQQSQNEFVQQQLEASLFHLTSDQIKTHITIAYEPIWAIGTGVTATTAQAQEMHAHIRSVLSAKYGTELSNEISILYGGSCNATNAAELFACHDVDGGLIGGAALKAETFLPIINAMQ